MKKLLLFAAEHYNAHGGIDDFMDDFETIEEAVDWLQKNMDEKYGWADIVEHGTLKKVGIYKNDKNRKGWVEYIEEEEDI